MNNLNCGIPYQYTRTTRRRRLRFQCKIYTERTLKTRASVEMMTVQPPLTQKNDDSRPRKLWESIAPKLISLVNLSAFLTVLGFFTIHSYLATVTQLFTYNISVAQYLAAGVSLFIALFWHLFSNGIAPVIPWIGVIFLIGTVGYVIWRLVLRDVVQNASTQSLFQRWQPVFKVIIALLRLLERVNQWVFTIGLLLICVLFGLVYGYGYYSQLPHMLGGGMPTDVILVFKEPQSTNAGWPFPINLNVPTQSEKVQLLFEFTDGLLVRDEGTRIAVIVKNDSLQAVMDASPAIIPGKSTVTPTVSPSATITP